MSLLSFLFTSLLFASLLFILYRFVWWTGTKKNGRLIKYRMFIPVEDSHGSQWIWEVDKDEKGQVKKRKTMGVRYVPLTDAPK